MAIAPIAITSGDHKGIGPEVISKGIRALGVSAASRSINLKEIVIFGTPELYEPYKKLLPKKWAVWTEQEFQNPRWEGAKPHHLNFIVPEVAQIEPNRRAAYACGRYIELATLGALAGKFSAVCTGPIDKNELHRGGYRFDGHTELLQKLCHAPSVTMMMAGPKMLTSLVTTHVALKDVSTKLSIENIVTCIINTASGLIRDFGLKKPRIAVLGLNPHASDSGLFGDEEEKKITPAIRLARKKQPQAVIEGPFPPDGFFAQWLSSHSKRFNAVVCMYHDQGLIPVKLLDFKNTVNVSLGLPIVRTSVDHGVGYDIAGRNKADPASFCAALKLAIAISKRRQKRRRKKQDAGSIQ